MDIPLMSRPQCTHTKNPCPAGHNSPLPCWIWTIFHTIVVHDPKVCHDLDSRSYLQGHAYPKLCLGLNSSLPSWILIIYHTNVSWPWLRVRSPRLRSKYTNGNFFFRTITFLGCARAVIVASPWSFFYVCFILQWKRNDARWKVYWQWTLTPLDT